MSKENDQFPEWLQSQLNATELRLDGWTSPQDIGYSNDTNFFAAHFSLADEKGDDKSISQKMVQRLEPTGAVMFREYDLGRQYLCMDYLGQHSSLPVPKMIGEAMSADRPFYVMEFLEGDIPLDGYTAHDAYTTKGFLFEATAAQRATYFTNLVRCIADLHKVPVDEGLKNYLNRSSENTTPLQKEVDWLIDLYHWGKDGHEVSSELEPYMQWLANNVPELDDADFLWGDARPANTLVQNFEISAMLDWELATTGPGESDLFYFFAAHEHREGQSEANKLEGIPSEAEMIRLYEEMSGKQVRHRDFFRYFSYIRMAVYLMLGCKARGISLDRNIFDTFKQTVRFEDIDAVL